MHLFEGTMLILFGLIVVVASLLDKFRAEDAEEDLIEGPFGGGVYVTRERLYNRAIFFLIFGLVLILFGVVFLLI
jgi:hypothetical protein